MKFKLFILRLLIPHNAELRVLEFGEYKEIILLKNGMDFHLFSYAYKNKLSWKEVVRVGKFFVNKLPKYYNDYK